MKFDKRVFPYVEAAVLMLLRNDINNIKRDFVPRQHIISRMNFLVKRDGISDLFEDCLDHFVNVGVVELIEDDVAGNFYSFHVDGINNYSRGLATQPDSIYARTAKVGLGLLDGALSNSQVDDDPELEIEVKSDSAPASDRIVEFNHNQVEELDDATTKVIEAVEAQNQIEGGPRLREMILGQLRAGRELVRSGCMRLYLLEVTLIETLRFLARRYEGELIGALASTLMAALAKHLGIDL